MKKETKIINSGRHPEKYNGSVNPPIYQTSTIVFPTLEAYLAAEKGESYYEEIGGNKGTDYSYGISGTTTSFELQEAISELEGGDYAWITPSGLAAITTCLLSLVAAGDHILVVDTIYGPTRRFCNKLLKNLGVETEYYDPLIGKGISQLIRDNTKLIFLESPGSLTFEIQDIPAITKIAKEKDIITIIDASWATPLHFQPFKHGCDISIQALTKYISGHADILLGSITCKEKHRHSINKGFRSLGVNANPHACYLALRGLKTLDVRLQKHQDSALKVANWLKGHDRVANVLYPALPDDAGYKIWKRDFSGANGLLSIILDKKYDQDRVSDLVNNLELFSIGASWGGFESLVLPFDPNEVRTATKWTHEGTCIRIHIGLENVDDLISDLTQGLERLK